MFGKLEIEREEQHLTFWNYACLNAFARRERGARLCSDSAKVTSVAKIWTEAEIAKMKALAGKVPAAEIAKKLGRGYGATIFKAHHLKVSLRLRRAVTQPADPTEGPETTP